MPLVNELIITVVGGVLTAAIISLFSGRRRRAEQAQLRRQAARNARAGGSTFGHFIRLLLAVVGGIAFAIFGGRYFFQSGILDRSLPMRMGLLIAGTVFIWWFLLLFRRR